MVTITITITIIIIITITIIITFAIRMDHWSGLSIQGARTLLMLVLNNKLENTQ